MEQKNKRRVVAGITLWSSTPFPATRNLQPGYLTMAPSGGFLNKMSTPHARASSHLNRNFASSSGTADWLRCRLDCLQLLANPAKNAARDGAADNGVHIIAQRRKDIGTDG